MLMIIMNSCFFFKVLEKHKETRLKFSPESVTVL